MRLLLLSSLVALGFCSPLFRPTARTTPDPQCSKYPNNPRACWNQYDIDTNYYDTVPETGVTREYYFDVVNTTAAPDGRPRPVMLVNGQFPGPTIEANWGDTVKVHVRNSLQNNGSSIHFHGIRQLNTNQNDGVQSLTQCPIAPGYNYTYTWRATEYGSSWYHSHFSLQAWEGVFGGIVIHGPAAADYDEDLGSLFLNDWALQTADEMYQAQITTPNVPQFEGGLLNGTNTYTLANGTTVGQRLLTQVQPGKRYRLRLINAALHTHFRFSVDEHDLTVISNDFVPIRPYTTNNVAIDMGQRYDIIINADQLANKNYWMRAVPQTFCSNNTTPDNIKGILHYNTDISSSISQQESANDTIGPYTDPTSIKQSYPGNDFQCVDEPYDNLVPWVPLNATTANSLQNFLNTTLEPEGSPTLWLWKIGKNAFQVEWDDPTLAHVSDHTTETQEDNDGASGPNIYEINEKDRWSVFIIQTDVALSHPIHLHGHDYFLLSQGFGPYNSSSPSSKLNLINPPRRDTITLPSQPIPGLPADDKTAPSQGGYAVIAFPADNPGAWLMHCHIGFHATEGFAVQVLERKAEIEIDREKLDRGCDEWKEYARGDEYGRQDDGGEFRGPWDSGV